MFKDFFFKDFCDGGNLDEKITAAANVSFSLKAL